MFIHSRIYKRLYPVIGVADLQSLDENERGYLVNLVRKAPRLMQIHDLEMIAKYHRLGYRINNEKLPEYHKQMDLLMEKAAAAANKIEHVDFLNDEEIHFINDVIYLHKYNRFWSFLFNLAPTKDKHPKTK